MVDNPVTQARGVEKLEESATPETKVLFDQVGSLQTRIELLETARAAWEPTANSSIPLIGSLILEIKLSAFGDKVAVGNLLEAYKRKFGAAVLLALNGDVATIALPETARRVPMKEFRPPWVETHDFQVRIVQ